MPVIAPPAPNGGRALDKTPTYVPITCFGKTAEAVHEYTDKGHLVSVEGRISSGKYTNDAGEPVYTLDVIAARVGFSSKPRNATTTPENVDTDNDTDNDTDDDTDDAEAA